jgi:hypothetical protein
MKQESAAMQTTRQSTNEGIDPRSFNRQAASPDRPDSLADDFSSNPGQDTRPLKTLLGELFGETSELVRQEVSLAQAEASVKLNDALRGLGFMILSGAICFAGLFYILDAVVFGVSLLMPEPYQYWLAALLVGVVVLIAGLLVMQQGKKTAKP